MRIPTGVTDQVIYFVATDSADHLSRKTGLSSFTVYRSRNGGAATAYTTPTVTEVSSANMPGIYKLLLDEDMSLDAGDDTQEIALHITAAGMDPATRVIELYRPETTMGETLSVSSGGLNAIAANVLTAAALAADAGQEIADALLDRSNGVETGLTPRQALRLMAAVLYGKADGLGTTTAHFRDTADSKNRVTATVDVSGNRTAVTLDAT